MKTNNNTHQESQENEQTAAKIFTIIAHSMLDESILIRIFLKASVWSLAQVSF
jgi:hypothetical protein